MIVGPGCGGLWLSDAAKWPAAQPPANPDDLGAALLALPVLIIEDEAMIAWMMESLLEEMGFTAISIAACGEDAVQMAERIHPELVISDINLGPGGIDGVEATIRIIRSTTTPVVFITAYASAEARDRIANDVPGAHLLRKPVSADTLRQTIVKAVSQARAH